MSLAPIALFVYRRPEHTRRTLESLLAADHGRESPLYIFCDGPRTPDAAAAVQETRRVVRALAPASAIVVEAEHNRGLARSIIDGVTELTQKHGKVIVVEDDLEVAPSFLAFLNQGLDRYADDEAVMQISGYQFPVEPPLGQPSLFLSFPTSWGWGTWARAWRKFDAAATGYATLRRDRALRRRFDLDGAYPYFDMLEQQLRGQIDSWAIRWRLSVFVHGGLVLYPGRSLVRNTGFDGSGTHAAAPFASATLAAATADWQLPPVALDADAQQRVYSYLRTQTGSKSLRNRVVQLGRVALSKGLNRMPEPVRAMAARLLARARRRDER